VFERLRKLITSLALPPGSPLSRNALAGQFGVSSTPIRDALMRLEEEGLVEVEIVKRLALEHSERLVDELNATIARQQKFAKAGDFEQFMGADNDFHRELYAATGNQELWDLVRSRSGHIDRLRRLHLPSPGKAQDIVRHHRLIVKAIGANQPDEAQRHLRKHLSGTLGYLAEIRARFPEYLSE